MNSLHHVHRPKIMDIIPFMVEMKANIETFEIENVLWFNGCLHTGGYLINLSICLTRFLCDGSTNQTLRLKADAKVMFWVCFGFCVLLFLSFVPTYLYWYDPSGSILDVWLKIGIGVVCALLPTFCGALHTNPMHSINRTDVSFIDYPNGLKTR